MSALDDGGELRVRERTILTVFDHSGPAPRAVEEHEVVTENGRQIRRSSRPIGSWEAGVLAAERCRGSWHQRALVRITTLLRTKVW